MKQPIPFKLHKNDVLKIEVSFKEKSLFTTTRKGFRTIHGVLKFIYEQLPEYKKKTVLIKIKNMSTEKFAIAEHRIKENRVPNSL